jgi:hypothetical protein
VQGGVARIGEKDRQDGDAESGRRVHDDAALEEVAGAFGQVGGHLDVVALVADEVLGMCELEREPAQRDSDPDDRERATQWRVPHSVT